MHKKLILLFLLVISIAISAAEVGAGPGASTVVAKPRIYSEEQQKLLQQFKQKYMYRLSNDEWNQDKKNIFNVIERGLHPDDLISNRCPILFDGIQYNDVHFVKKLLERGADPNIKHGMYSALEQAESVAMAKLLLAHKADMQRSIYFKEFGPTILFNHWCSGAPPLVLLYSSRGVDPRILNNPGDSALDSFIRGGAPINNLEELIPYCIAMEMPFRPDIIDRRTSKEDAKRIHAALAAAQSEHNRAKQRAADLPGILTGLHLVPGPVSIIQAYDGPAIAPAIAQKLLEIEDMKEVKEDDQR